MTWKTVRTGILSVLLLLQSACAVILCFGDIGFDKPGRYGLDFGAAILLLVLYVVSLMLGLVLALAFKPRYLWLSGAQLLPICCMFAYVILPNPHYEAAHYQFLVGKSKADLVRAIGHPRGAITGLQGGEGKLDEEFMSVAGMTVIISHNGTILRVETNGLVSSWGSGIR